MDAAVGVNAVAELPNLLYVGDVPVEASHHGSALLYRLFEQYPVGRLLIVECGEPSRPDLRLPGVSYRAQPIGRRRWLNTRFHRVYSTWLSATAPWRARQIASSLSGFRPAAIVTVGHGHGWLLAAGLAEHLQVPLHLIVHDDWPRLAGVVEPLKGWLERRFAGVYRQARTRLCVSPFMAEEYERRYGVAGSVLYPFRSSSCPAFEVKEARPIQASEQIVLGYGGNSGPEMMACLRDLAGSLTGVSARVLVFGPFSERQQNELLALSPAFTFKGLVPYREMIAGLREDADVLFVPMTFDPGARDNNVVSFPSKLADYTAVGLPIFIYGPPYCSAVRWARMHDSVAHVVDVAGPAALAAGLERLKGDPEGRRRLSQRALEVGEACFASTSGQEQFYRALTDAGRPA